MVLHDLGNVRAGQNARQVVLTQVSGGGLESRVVRGEDGILVCAVQEIRQIRGIQRGHKMGQPFLRCDLHDGHSHRHEHDVHLMDHPAAGDDVLRRKAGAVDGRLVGATGDGELGDGVQGVQGRHGSQVRGHDLPGHHMVLQDLRQIRHRQQSILIGDAIVPVDQCLERRVGGGEHRVHGPSLVRPTEHLCEIGGAESSGQDLQRRITGQDVHQGGGQHHLVNNMHEPIGGPQIRPGHRRPAHHHGVVKHQVCAVHRREGAVGEPRTIHLASYHMVLEDLPQVRSIEKVCKITIPQSEGGDLESIVAGSEKGVLGHAVQLRREPRLGHSRHQVGEALGRGQLHERRRRRQLQDRFHSVDHPVPALQIGPGHQDAIYVEVAAGLGQVQLLSGQGCGGHSTLRVRDHDPGRYNVLLQQLGQALLVRLQLIEGHGHLREVGLESRIGRSEHREGPGAGQGIHQLRVSEGLHQSGGVAAGLGNLNYVGHEQLIDGIHDPVAGLRRRCRKGDPVNENL
mmetsp:Transcript_81683/g.218584  ORF Transcript_81683/g.218584 Transcript_81683/m.218584 type:complete len:513 (-) Transcript_81683:17-1555(-)